ncbi:N-methyl-L-tryptophan oxidase [Streptomyces sp. 7-21]|jgi:sarcosine oxidase|uniref:N-methyl-L-tryptophan oxidase n=1 Tax=Streptomyces sp. 7-21 TaxID=2802283 RepID=UPI00191F3CC9|nr:N-methyl-L-tryptophan oxidase [Streptomyces sp. 7-21]MBL1066058.1 N-methyl-L-tryptophan oxidase [Streptomyces sp. 7-21]
MNDNDGTAGRGYDVAVVGLGAMGAMTAWRLARAGASVIGFEQFGLAHDRGASAGESRLFRMAYHEGAGYVPMLRRSRELWDELSRASGLPLFLPTGCLSIGLPDLPPMRNVRRSVEEHGLPHEVLTGAELAARYPQHLALQGEIGVLDVNGGVLRPELAVLAACERARAHGARLLHHTRVDEVRWDERGGGVRIEAGGTRYTARKAVVTAGPWSARLVPFLRGRLTVKPLVLTWFAPSDPGAYAPERFPAFIRDTEGVHLFGVPMLDGMSVKTGFADVWEPLPGPEAFTRDWDEERLRPVSEAVRRFLPGLHPDPVRHDVYLEGYLPDRTALVDWVPESGERVLALAGFSGHGFKLAPVFGQIAADLVLAGGSGFDLTPMSAGRLA